MPGPPPMPAPSMPSSPMGTAPAMPGQVQQGGKEARGKILGGMALEVARLAMMQYPASSPDAVFLSEIIAKMGKRFSRPQADMMQSELKFMGSQLGAEGGPQGAPSPQGPPAPQMPSPGPMPMAA